MLENIVGPEGVAPEELDRDIRILCALSSKDLRDMAKVFAQFTGSLVSDENKVLKSIEKNVKSFQKDRSLLNSALPAAGFILRRWAERDLTRAQIVDDLVGLEISEEQKANLEPLLDVMEENIQSIRNELLESHAMNLGIPRIKTATCACDARAVFRSNRYDEAKDDEQAYFVLSRFVPVAILEIVSELNEQKTTHGFLLNEEQLEELINILQRARKRIERVKARLAKSTSFKDLEK